VRAARALSLCTLALAAVVAVALGPAPAGASQAQAFPTVVGLRVGRHASFDRVVIQLRGGLPSWNVRYVNPFRDDASGKVVHLRGRAFLDVALHGAVSHDAQGNSTVPTRRILVNFPALREVNERGDFEAVETIAIGVSRRTSFRVFGVRNPDRVVIDIDHPAATAGPSAAAGQQGPAGGALPFTGGHELALGGVAAALLAGGGVLLAATRRARRRRVAA
jgi:hypothetical protein